MLVNFDSGSGMYYNAKSTVNKCRGVKVVLKHAVDKSNQIQPEAPVKL